MAATQGSSSSVPAYSVKILKFSLKFKFPRFPKTKTFGNRCLMTRWILVMFDEDTGADGPAALLCGNRMAYCTTLTVFSCAWSSLKLCRGGIKAPSGHRCYVPSLKCVALAQSPHTSFIDCKSSLGSLPYRTCKCQVKVFLHILFRQE